MDPEARKIIEAADNLINGVLEMQRRHKALNEAMQKELLQVCISYFPEVESNCDVWEKLLVNDIKHCSENVVGQIEWVWSATEEQLLQFQGTVCTIKSEEEIKMLIDEELAKKDAKYHPMIAELFREHYDFENYFNAFLLLLHRKMKEIVYRIYPEIVDMSGDQLRCLDYWTYVMGACEFKGAFLWVAGGSIERLRA